MEEGQVEGVKVSKEIRGFTCPETFVTFGTESDLNLYRTRSRTFRLVKSLRATVMKRGMNPHTTRSIFTPVSMVYEYGQKHNPQLKVIDEYFMNSGRHTCKLKLQDIKSSPPRTLYFTMGTSIGKQEAKTCAAVAMFDIIMENDASVVQRMESRAQTLTIKPTQKSNPNLEARRMRTQQEQQHTEKQKQPEAQNHTNIDNNAIASLYATMVSQQQQLQQQQQQHHHHSQQQHPQFPVQMQSGMVYPQTAAGQYPASTSTGGITNPLLDAHSMLELQQVLNARQQQRGQSDGTAQVPQQMPRPDGLELPPDAKKQRVDMSYNPNIRYLQHAQAPSPIDPRRGIIF